MSKQRVYVYLLAGSAADCPSVFISTAALDKLKDGDETIAHNLELTSTEKFTARRMLFDLIDYKLECVGLMLYRDEWNSYISFDGKLIDDVRLIVIECIEFMARTNNLIVA